MHGVESYRPEISVAGFIPLQGSGRQIYNFNPGWRYYKGDVQGAESVSFDDSAWEIVSTPHTVELMRPKPVVAVTIRELSGIVSVLSFPLRPKDKMFRFILKLYGEAKCLFEWQVGKRAFGRILTF